MGLSRVANLDSFDAVLTQFFDGIGVHDKADVGHVVGVLDKVDIARLDDQALDLLETLVLQAAERDLSLRGFDMGIGGDTDVADTADLLGRKV